MRWRAWCITALVGVPLLWFASGWAALSSIRARTAIRCEETIPAALVSRVEAVRLHTSDGEDLGAWFLDALRDDAPTVIELHGKGGTRGVRLGAADVVRERGCAVLLVTLRAHGDSSGDDEDFGWSASRDVIASVDWVSTRRPGRKVFVNGASLGAAAAVFAAGELGDRVDGYALECLYGDLAGAARSRCAMYLPPVLDDVAWLALLTAAQVTWPEFRSISPLDAIATIPESASILLLAGGADQHARRDETEALFARVAHRARLVVIEGAPHDRLQSQSPERYRTALLDWLTER